jgi:phenylpropionate dioxygenase-like ring-hydroxylating dioxygenase large terminal subunit
MAAASASGGTGMRSLSDFPALYDHWFIVCRSAELRDRPLPRTLLGASIVVFRAADGTASVLADLCPHRNVPLSAGRVRGGHLACAYHGWQFDGSGTCRMVPGLESAPERRSRSVATYATREQDGFVWAYAAPDQTPKTEPHSFAYLHRTGFRAVRTHFDVTATLPDALENFLDTTHTHFVHRKTIRRDDQRRQTTVIVQRDVESVSARYVDDGQHSGMIDRLFRGGVDTSIDRFKLPSVVELEHWAGKRLILLISIFFSPEDASRSRAYVVACGEGGPLRHLMARTLGLAMLRPVIRQDQEMLRLQYEAKTRAGVQQYTSTQLDFMRPHVLRLLRGGSSEGGPDAVARERTIELFI